MKLFAVVAATVLAAGSGGARAATRDVLGREVPIGHGRPALVFYTNRDNQAALHDSAFGFTYRLRRAMPLVVVHVDLSDVPSLLRGLAIREIRRAERESLAEMARVFHAHGKTPPPQLARSLYMVADAHGASRRALGLQEHFRQPYAQALDADGRELARGPFPQDAREIAQAIRAHAPVAEAER